MNCQKCGKELKAHEDNLFGLADFEYLCSDCRPADPAQEVDENEPEYEGEPIEHSIFPGDNIKPSLEILNATDEPRAFGGECLGDDGHGNQLWLFRSVNKLANRWGDENNDSVYQWTDDITGWNYDVNEFGLE